MNLPNKLTTLRVFMIPFFVFFLGEEFGIIKVMKEEGKP